MRFLKSSIKLALCAGRLLNKQSHVQVKQAHESCEKNCFTDVKTTQTKFLWFPSNSCSKTSNVGARVRSQPLQSKEIKISSVVWFTGFTNGLSSRQRVLSNFKSKYLCSMGQKAEKTSQTSGFQLQIKEGIFQAMLHFWYKKELLNCQRSHLKPPSRDSARTVYTAENLIFTSFFATSGIQWLWVKIGTQA